MNININIFNFPPLLAGLANLCLAGFVVLRNPRGKANQLFGLVCLALAIWNTGFFMMYYVPNTGEGYRQALMWNNCLHLGLLFLAPLSYHFMLAVSGVRRRWLYSVAHGGYMISAAFMWYSIRGVFIAQLQWVPWNPVYGGWVPRTSTVSSVFDNFFFFYMCLGIGALFYRYVRASEAVERNRLRYLIIAIVIALLGGIPNFLLVHRVVTIYPIGHVMQILYVLVIAYTIVRYRLMNISVAIRRGAWYSVVTAGVGGVYALVLLLLMQGVRAGARDPVPYYLLAIMAFGLALAFQPLQKRLQRLVDRRFFKEEYEAQQILRDLSGTVVSFLEINELLEYTLETLRRALGVARGFIYLSDNGRYVANALYPEGSEAAQIEQGDWLVRALSKMQEPLLRDEIVLMLKALNLSAEDKRLLVAAQRRMQELQAQVAVPLRSKEGLSGFVLVGDKRSEDLFSPADVALLATLGNQLSVAVENARLYDRLRQAYRDLEDAQRQLYQSEKLAAIGELAAGVAHEINNPLGAILITAQRIRRVLPREQRADEWMGGIEEAVMRCKEIVRGLLDFARQNVPEMVRTDIHSVLQRTISLARTHPSIRDIKIVTEFESGVPQIIGDPNQLVQVFLNLFVNAGLAMPDGGTLTIRTLRNQGRLVVEVEDTGCGIAPDMLDKIFHPFVSTRGERGTGLGLSVSYGIVERHRGRIWAESEVGRGSTFYVELPTEQPRHQQAARQA